MSSQVQATSSEIRKSYHWLRAGGVISFLVILAFTSIILASAIGSAYISPLQEIRMIAHALGLPIAVTWSESDSAILFQLRMPRVVAAFLVGCGLSSAGLVMQGVFRNPLADPYILGSSSGAGLGAVLAMALALRWNFLGFAPVPLLAFVGAMLSVVLVYIIAGAFGSVDPTRLILAGVAVGSFLGAIMSFIMAFTPLVQSQLKAVFVWLLGGVGVSGWNELRVLLPLFFITILVLFFMSSDLDALTLGDEGASYLGVNVTYTRIVLIGVSALLTASAVSVSGLIGFVGLVVPHVMRMAFGPKHAMMIPVTALAGGSFMVIIDLLARVALSPNEVPVGILTAMIGAPFFLFMLRKLGRGYSL